VAVLQAIVFCNILYINNIETIPDYKGLEEDPPKHNPADSLACLGLRAQLRLEQRLLRSKDGNGLCEVTCRLRLYRES